MIDIKDKKFCVGCAACVQICPRQCISFNEDGQGFRYPKVDLDLCIHCNLCEKVCPVINQADPQFPTSVYAARNNDEEIMEHSSSGGIFHALARQVIEGGGVVFGARFNKEWEIVHGHTEKPDGIKAFQTSKYVQSYIGESFRKAEEFLKSGRRVLFSGTPCQIAALNLYLRKDYGHQLIKVDVVCHGVPSPGIWRDYLNSLLRRLGAKKNSDFQSTLNDKMPVVTGINFRDKKLGWKKFGFSVHAVARKGDKNTDFQSTIDQIENRELFFEPHYENLFMRGFLEDLYLRPSCYECPARCGKSHADITLADFWGIQSYYPKLYKQQYYSLVLSKTEKGDRILKELKKISIANVKYETSMKGNSALVKSPKKPKEYLKFWNDYQIYGLQSLLPILNSMKPSLLYRSSQLIKKMVKRLLKVTGLIT